MKHPEPTREFQWLLRLLGEWTFEHDAPAIDGQPATKMTGAETFRAIGNTWVQGEGSTALPDGSTAISQMTLGWNPTRKRYEGAWIGSMMSWLWVYHGELDSDGRVLSLYSSGPNMQDETTIGEYKDVVEIVDENHRTLTGHMKTADGTWQEFMRVHYRRA